MKKTLVPLTEAQMRLIVDCLAYCEAHPSHKDIEITDVKEKVLFFALKDKNFEPVKNFNKESPDTINGSGVISEGIEQMEKVGERTKRKYNKSKLNNLKPPFGLA